MYCLTKSHSFRVHSKATEQIYLSSKILWFFFKKIIQGNNWITLNYMRRKVGTIHININFWSNGLGYEIYQKVYTTHASVRNWLSNSKHMHNNSQAHEKYSISSNCRQQFWIPEICLLKDSYSNIIFRLSAIILEQFMPAPSWQTNYSTSFNNFFESDVYCQL